MGPNKPKLKVLFSPRNFAPTGTKMQGMELTNQVINWVADPRHSKLCMGLFYTFKGAQVA